MKSKFILLFGLAAILCAGCLSPASKINTVSLGMTKDQVLKIMGTPVSVTTDGKVECLNYNLAEVPTYFDMPGTPYEVRLVDGKVASYGRAGTPESARPVPMPIIVPATR